MLSSVVKPFVANFLYPLLDTEGVTFSIVQRNLEQLIEMLLSKEIEIFLSDTSIYSPKIKLINKKN